MRACRRLPGAAQESVRPQKSGRFTLIELLVCIAVIMILVALLMPTLSRVRYRAKLVVCMNNLKQVGTGLQMIADKNNGRYYDRQLDDGPHKSWNYITYLKSNHEYDDFDDRPGYREYIANDLWTCPMSGPAPDIYNYTGVAVRTSYNVFAGYKPWVGDSDDAKLKKPGDTMTFKGDSFDVIAGDNVHGQYWGNRWLFSSHPQSSGAYRARWASKSTSTRVSTGGFGVGGTVDGHYDVGPFDLNYVRTDGSAYLLKRAAIYGSRLRKIPTKPHTPVSINDFAVAPVKE